MPCANDSDILIQCLQLFLISFQSGKKTDAWAKSRVDEAPQAAERVLKLMMDNERIEPDTLSYQGVLEAWAQSGKQDSLERVKQIYDHMHSLRDSGKNIKPSVRTANAIVHAHAKRAAAITYQYDPASFEKAYKCAEDAHGILKEMKQRFAETNDPDDQPDVMTYTSVMDAYARVGNYKATQQAELLMRELKNEYEKTRNQKLRPNYRTYTSLVTAWSRTRSHESPGRVEQLLMEMGDDPVTMPNTRTYTSVIQCWAKSKDATKAKRALKILREMKDKFKETNNDEVRPNIITYNAAIDACARCQGNSEQQTEALKIAFAISKAIDADPFVQPNSTTFVTLLNVAAFLLPAGTERNSVASAVFEKAKKAGLVEASTIKSLRKAVDGEVFQQLLECVVDRNGGADLSEIPAAWSKNVQ